MVQVDVIINGEGLKFKNGVENGTGVKELDNFSSFHPAYLRSSVLEHRGFLAVSIKVEEASAGSKENATEYAVLKQLKHRFVAKYIGYTYLGTGRVKDHLTIMEHLTGRSLMSHEGGGISMDDRVQNMYHVFIPIISALSHLHSIGYVHSAIEPESIQMSFEAEPKLVGFERARVVDANNIEQREDDFTYLALAFASIARKGYYLEGEDKADYFRQSTSFEQLGILSKALIEETFNPALSADRSGAAVLNNPLPRAYLNLWEEKNTSFSILEDLFLCNCKRWTDATHGELQHYFFEGLPLEAVKKSALILNNFKLFL